MNAQLNNLTRSLTKHPGAIPSVIYQAMDTLCVKPPADYFEFMLATNGAEGFMPNGRYLMLDPVEKLVPCNQPYGIGALGPGMVSFGSDGGVMLYAFDIRRDPVIIVEVDATCMDTGPVNNCGSTFVEFLEYINLQH